MAPRSYLARIAQPLAAGDPVVWSVPRASAEESRPPAVTDAHRGAPGVRAAPKAAERPAGSPPAESIQPLVPGPAPGIDAPHPVAPVAASNETSTLASAASFPASHDNVEGAPPTSIETSAPSRARRAEPGEVAAAADQPFGAIDPTSPATAGDSPASRGDPPITGARAAAPRVAHASRLSPLETAPALRRDRAAPPVAAAHPPRLHIGTIEVRTAPPQPAPPAPSPVSAAPASRPPAAGRIGRAYAWRFGLAQG